MSHDDEASYAFEPTERDLVACALGLIFTLGVLFTLGLVFVVAAAFA